MAMVAMEPQMSIRMLPPSRPVREAAMAHKKTLPIRLTIMISWKLSPMARLAPAIRLMMAKIKPVQIMVRLM